MEPVGRLRQGISPTLGSFYFRSSSLFRSLRMPSTGSHQVFDAFDGLNAAAGADGGAVEGGGGAGEVELSLQRPTLQEPVDEAGVEDVSGTGSVNRLDAKSAGV